MLPIRRYDPAILDCTKRTRTLAQIVQTLHRVAHSCELQEPMNPGDIELRCEVLSRAGALERLVLTSGEIAYRRRRARRGAARPGRIPVGRGLKVGLMASVVLTAYGCANFDGLSSAPHVPEDLPRYHTEKAPNLSQVYQVPGQVVYLLCDGKNCLAPTPKVIARALPAQTAEVIPLTSLDRPLPAPHLEADLKAPSPKAAIVAKVEQDAVAPEVATGRVAVFFDFASAKLDEKALETLKSQADAIRAAKRIVVTGRTDQVGSLERNKLFAQKRARAVRDALVAAGIPRERISVEVDPKTSEALHPKAYSAFKPTAEDAIARRVDLLIH